MGRRGRRAVVLGAGLAALFTARVLSDSFDEVVLVDRDTLPDGPLPRRGVPQSWQSHGLHARGREILEGFFPGLTAELVAHGASLGDVQADVRWVNDGHRLRRARSGMEGIAFSRPLLEDLVRKRVRATPGVTVRAPVHVLRQTTEGARVTGVRVRDRSTPGDGESMPGDLVVDATGRGSHTPVWLEELGFPAPRESAVEVRVGYTTWEFPRRPGDLGGDIAAIIGSTVAVPRFGAMLATEGDRWQVTAGGYLGDHASATDVDAFRAFAASLPAPDIGELVADRDPLGPGRLHRIASSRRRHYEGLARFPSGYLVIGDALSSFNPAYGQGMTVAAAEALALQDLLAGPVADEDLARRFLRRAARIVDIPWGIAGGGDLRLPGVPGRRPIKVRVINAYVARVQAAAAVDAEVGRAFLRVANTVDQPQALLRPAIALRVLRATASRGGRELAEPGGLPAGTPVPLLRAPGHRATPAGKAPPTGA
ncbi:FAD-dependent oxidoreductase [Blastococcus deserti]|uniref:FAD-dependent oxidoreductase n=1 Tax=Blastococcus deserti TaxID=2259033 RepID=A0ABW4X8Z7_9ACTN